MNIFEKLQAVQSELKAPKGQYNSFGKYKYRSCEDILEAAKPVLAKHKAAITISDDIVQVGERYYIKATARFYDTEAEHEPIANTAFARESNDKKGMDESQITGTASSYARKYCLNGLLLIDDTKDADTDENHIQTTGQEVKESKAAKVAKLKLELERTGVTTESLLGSYKLKMLEGASLEQSLAQLNDEQYESAMRRFSKTPAKGAAS